MIFFHDRIGVEVWGETGEVDRYGNPVEGWIDAGEVPGHAEPLATDERLTANRDVVVTRYKLYLAPVDALAGDPAKLRFTWHGLIWKMDGDLLQHTLGGRLHHYEATGQRGNG